MPVRRDVLESSSIRRPLICIAGAALLAVAGCTGSAKVGPDAVASLTPDGTVEMREVQVAYIGSGGGGNGTLYYRGQAYPFPAYQPRDPTQVADFRGSDGGSGRMAAIRPITRGKSTAAAKIVLLDQWV